MSYIRNLFLSLGIGTFTISTFAFSDDVASENEKDTLPEVTVISEAFGHLIAHNLDSPGFQFNLQGVIKGMQDASEGKVSPLTEIEYEQAITVIQKTCFDELANQNLHDANDFMSKNANNEEVIELVPGKLHISILEMGSGYEIAADSTPLVHYTGKYMDETVFSSSKDIGEPIPLELDRAIPGFTQGLVGAKVGEKRRLYIHPDLAYGTSDLLPPNSLLIFDIEIISSDIKSDNNQNLIDALVGEELSSEQ